MVMSFVSNLMSRLKWTERLPESEVIILHRGAPKNQKRINGDHITEIKRGSFSYMDTENQKETYIPMHRVLEIWMDQKVVWKKRNNNTAKSSKTKNNSKTSKKTKAKKTKKSTSSKKRAAR